MSVGLAPNADLVGEEDFRKKLLDVADRAHNLEPMWDEVADDVWKPRQLAVFTSGKLAPLNPETVKRKKVNKTTPMVATGELRYITHRYSPIKSTRDSASFGIPKGSGAKSGRGRKSIGAMHAKRSGSRPARDVVPRLTIAERREIMAIVEKFVTGPST